MLKKVVVFVVFVLFSTLVNGCVARPQFINGNYYYTGDSECRWWRMRTETSINCYDSESDTTPNFHRNAMTDQQLQMHMHRERELQRQIDNNNKQIRDRHNKSTTTHCLDMGGIIRCNTF